MNSKTILVPVTLNEGSGAALAVAAKLAEDLSAKIVLLHVLPEGSPVTELELAKTRLQALAEKTHLQLPIECVTSTGPAASQIVAKALELNADSLVMCTHAYRGWFKWLHRYTVREVLGRIHCPVWLISPGPGGAMPTLSILAREEDRRNFPRGGSSTNLFPFPASLRNLRPAA
jgi:nucleotide-binding universal stress UspA family protein